MSIDLSTLPDLLQRTADLLRLSGANDFKAGAWEKAIPIVEEEGKDLLLRTSEASLGELPKIGASLARELHAFLTTGELPRLVELEQTLPEGLISWLEINGLGPKRAAKIHQTLQISTREELAEALRDGRVAAMKGFGEKTASKLLEAIVWQDSTTDRCRFDEALELSAALRRDLENVKGVLRLETAGSLRRSRETIGDLDFLAVVEGDGSALHEAFCSAEGVQEVLVSGETKSSVRLSAGRQADLRTVEEPAFPAAWIYFTGSKEHNVFLRGRAREKDLTLNEYGLYPLVDGEADRDHPVPCADEGGLYDALDLPWTPPELREGIWQKAIEEHALPVQVQPEDLKGVLHAHSTWSDGKNTLEEMARACIDMGFSYLGITDHSQTSFYARGLKPDQVEAQWKEIDALNTRFRDEGLDFTLLKGIESDIRPDGALDYEEDLLAGFDFVIASLHQQLDQEASAMQARVETALQNPHTTLLGHPTTRLLLGRAGAKLDLEPVIRLAAARGVGIELNCTPKRMELDWRWGPLAREVRLKTAICPDAHAVEQLAQIFETGIPLARKGGFEPERILNCRPVCDRNWLTGPPLSPNLSW